ncbi:uncharacterized protein [Dermacentor andersoni]|uniref:uncharacterized protein isoform X1 n=1 Tax=Dermacentor andersoni TaxID=34620 RepID=UPI0024162E77|nr:uncharacterized protein LOC129385407 isoform X2 [Dermacentor andersoni]
MYIRLLAPFALYAFVFANHSPCLAEGYRETKKSYLYEIEASRWLTEGFIISVEIPDSPIVLSINVMDLGGRLANLTGARTSYRVIYYNNDSMILADRDPGVWDKALCSLWTTKNYFRKSERDLPASTKAYYRSNCEDPKYVPFPASCWT